MKNIIFLTVIAFSWMSFKGDPKATKKETLFGIDISEYQDGDIDWAKVKKSKHNVKFVIIRATMGDDRKDDKFKQRIKEVREAGFITGAYHYYDPNEVSATQAANYISRVELQKGDFIPIVDLERFSKIQSTDKLKQGLKNWLNIVEKHYGVKPMLYTGYTFYVNNLADDFSEYPLWVATYSKKKRTTEVVKNAKFFNFQKKYQFWVLRARLMVMILKRKNLKN